MALKLHYADKYRLWNSLVRGNTDRLFVPTTDSLRLGDIVQVEIHVGGASLPLVAHGTLVGVRHQSRRFPQGVYLRITHKELEKFRRFLALQSSPYVIEHARRTIRVHHEFPVRFIEPKGDEIFVTRNVSETGIFLTCPPDLHSGQRVSLYLVIEDQPLRMNAEVAWAYDNHQMAGLMITEVSDRAAARLHATLCELRNLSEADRRPRPILVADDDDSILKFISTALEKHGHEVFRSGNGDETFELVRQLQPELVVMDILMPGTDGSEICKAMRADAELAGIKVIFVSALDPETLHAVADESGATDYLAKPLHLAELMDVIKYYLD